MLSQWSSLTTPYKIAQYTRSHVHIPHSLFSFILLSFLPSFCYHLTHYTHICVSIVCLPQVFCLFCSMLYACYLEHCLVQSMQQTNSFWNEWVNRMSEWINEWLTLSAFVRFLQVSKNRLFGLADEGFFLDATGVILAHLYGPNSIISTQ